MVPSERRRAGYLCLATMSTSNYYAEDDDEDGNGHPKFHPYTLSSQNFTHEPIANGSRPVARAPNDSSPLFRGPIEARSDHSNARPLPNAFEQVQASYPVERREKPAGREVQALEMSTVRKDDMFYMKSLFLRVCVPF